MAADHTLLDKTALTGAGGTDALDERAWSQCRDGDIALVYSGGKFYFFVFDASSSNSEVTSTRPMIITPNDAGANAGRWVEKLLVDIPGFPQLSEPPAEADKILVYDDSAGLYKYVTYEDLRDAELSSRTINLDNSMSATDIQDEIEAVGKYIPTGKIVTFQFADGTYTLTNGLTFQGFYGGGTLLIQGNISETNATTLHTTQQVFLNFSGGNCNGLVLQSNRCKLKIQNLKIYVADSSSYKAINASYCHWVDVWYNYLLANGTSNSQLLVFTQNSAGYAKYNYFHQGRIAIYTNNNSHLMSAFNDDTSTQPAYGLWADTNGVIGKNSTQPSGSTANENTGTGGVIR